MTCSLLELANELITLVVDCIHDVETLRALARTCSRLQSLTEPKLYQCIFQRTGQEAVDLSKAIDARPERADGIQVIDSRCKWQKRAGLIYLAQVVSAASNLRELTIESPYCNNAYGKEVEEWQSTMHGLLRPVLSQRNLSSRLRNLTLHLTGSERYWPVDHRLSAIFTHPSLSSLTVSCAELHGTHFKDLERCSSTPLKQLVLIESNITQEALKSILSVPAALEELSLGENCYHQWLNKPQFRKDCLTELNQLCSKDAEAFFSSLSQQKDSLKSLVYCTRGLGSRTVELPATCKGLSEFTQLEKITLDGYCPYFEKTIALESTAPPNLRLLVARGDMFRLQRTPGLNTKDDYRSQVGWTLAAATVSRQLQNVRIVSSRTFTNVSRAHRDAVEQLGEEFKEKKVSMQLSKWKSHGSIPPFLYGEKPFSEGLLYESEHGFCQELRPSGDREDNDIDF